MSALQSMLLAARDWIILALGLAVAGIIGATIGNAAADAMIGAVKAHHCPATPSQADAA